MTWTKRSFVAAVFGFSSTLGLAGTLDAQGPTRPPIDWVDGPTVVKLGSVGQITVPAGYRFADGVGARKLLELTHNLPSGGELGVIIPQTDSTAKFWFTIFQFSRIGYVKDDEKDRLDADALLASIRKGTAEGNDLRRQKGWTTMEVQGWARKPFYDPVTNNLTWAIIGVNSDGERSVNHSVRILGRSGAMEAGLVLSPEGFVGAVRQLDTLLTGFRYVEGQRYSEWREGDQVAKYGLTALVAGTAGAVAMKTGLLAKLWKVIVLGAIAVATAVKSFVTRTWQKITRRQGPNSQP